MGSEDMGWKSCPAPTYAAENLTTCSTTKYDAEVEGVLVYVVTVFCPLCALPVKMFVKYKAFAIFGTIYCS